MPCHTNTDSKTANKSRFLWKKESAQWQLIQIWQKLFQNVLVNIKLTFTQNLGCKFIPKFSLKHQIVWSAGITSCHPAHALSHSEELWGFVGPLCSSGFGYHQHSTVSHFPFSSKITMLFFFVSELPCPTLIWEFSKQDGKKLFLFYDSVLHNYLPKDTGLHWWPKNINRQELYFLLHQCLRVWFAPEKPLM